MKTKKFFCIIVIYFIAIFHVLGQSNNVGIGTLKPDESAALDISSSSKGLLLPRMSRSQKELIENPAIGLVVYQTDLEKGFYFFDGLKWKPISKSESNSVAASNPENWSIIGNSGINHYDNFIGSALGNKVPIMFRINGKRAGFIDLAEGEVATGYSYTGTGSIFFGSNAGRLNTGTANIGLGAASLELNTIGSSNMGIGTLSLSANVDGFANTAVGVNTLSSNVSGYHNIALGEYALSKIVNGYGNTGIGVHAGFKLAGSSNKNVFIGHYAGDQITSGVGNVLIGYTAGSLEPSLDNKLYISNSNSSNPLIKGDFSTNNLQINSKTTGYLAIGDFTTAAAASPGTGGIPLPANIGQAGGYRLVVQDGILCEKVKVALRSNTGADWADYVFEPEYKANMMTLEEVEKFTLDNKHLPNVPSAKEMTEEGLDVAKTSKMFMEKIEELTLYMIELNKEVKALKAENAALKGKK